MLFRDWAILLVPSIISVISIFISNALGVKSSKLNKQLQTQEDSYLHYHIPLIQWISKYNPNTWSYFYLTVVPTLNHLEEEFLLKHILQNIQYAPKDVAQLYPIYFDLGGNFDFYIKSSPNFGTSKAEEDTIRCAKIFDKIIINSLKEASRLAIALGYPDTAEPILKAFLEGIDTSESYSRHRAPKVQ